jgi:hypothetical protein
MGCAMPPIVLVFMGTMARTPQRFLDRKSIQGRLAVRGNSWWMGKPIYPPPKKSQKSKYIATKIYSTFKKAPRSGTVLRQFIRQESKL